jgi:hypothetical protein
MRSIAHYFRLSLIASIACGALLAAASASAQTMSFVFIAPAATMTSTFGAANVQGGYVNGYRGVRVTPANLAAFQKVASPNMLRTYNALQPGTALRTKIDRVMRISHSLVFDVEVRLVDDRNGVTGNVGFATSSHNNKTYIWPAAWSDPVTTPRKGHQGFIGIGEFWAADHVNDMGWTGWESVLLHETLHTQFVGEHTKWGSVTITYGMDGVHYFSEILGAQDLAFEEGLGTFYGYTHYHPQGLNATNTFWSRADDRYLTEDASIPVSWAELRNAASRRENVRIPDDVRRQQPDRETYTRYYFHWNRVPGKYLLFNEWTSAAFHMYFWRHVNNDPDQALEMIDEMAGWMWGELRRRYPTYAANNLATQLEAFAATPAGQAKKTAGTLTSSMFPIALLDLLTHFGMTDAQFQLEFRRDQHAEESQALRQYWTTHRAAVRKLVEADLAANPIRFQQAVTAIHTYFQQPATILTKP